MHFFRSQVMMSSALATTLTAHTDLVHLKYVLAGHKISNRSKVGFTDHVCSMKRRKEENKKIQK